MNAPDVHCTQFHAAINVRDLNEAIEFYTNKLGFWLAFQWGQPPSFAGVNLGEVQMFLEAGDPSPKGCVLYFLVDDLQALYDFHRQNGVEVVQEPADHEWAIRDYVVRDLNGYYLLFGKHLRNA
ncbi:MAG TPA: VOC family protein [Thermoanaerobaculia bacterium]|nr:VOC family protein [Thermoanaerobaculia bacterium]